MVGAGFFKKRRKYCSPENREGNLLFRSFFYRGKYDIILVR